MKKVIFFLLFAVVLIGLAWLVWFRPADQEEAATPAPTEVAVHVAPITRTTLRGYVTAYGTVEPEPAGKRPAASARVAPAVPGVIAKVDCFEGQQVKSGALLFELDSRTVDVAVEFAEKTLERQKKLIQVEGTSQRAVEDAEGQLATARAQRALLRVRSPLAGTVTRVNVKPGQAVDLTTTLAEVIDLNRLVVTLKVPATELTELQVGQAVNVRADKSAAVVPGSLSYIGPEVDAQTGTSLVRVTLSADSGLRPGQFVTGQIICTEHPDCLAVPVDSVVKNEEGATVIAVVQNDTSTQKPVKTGLRDGGLVEIEADGLQPGMTVVTEGAYGLPAETKVRVIK